MATEQFDADSNVTLINSFSVLVNSLNNHANDLRDVSQLKSSPDGVNQEELVALEQRIRVMEHTFKAVRRHLNDEADAIAEVKNLQNVVHEHTEQIQKICSHLPEHLPQQIFGAHNAVPQNVSKPKQQQRASKPVEKAKENDATFNEGVESTNEPAAQPKTGRKKARKPVTKCTDRIPRLRYLTVDEFSAVPSYIRGRLSLTKVNSALNELQIVVRQKYELFDKNPRKLGSRQQDILLMYKEQETPDTEGRFFVTERELRKAATCTMKNDTGRAIIQTLRHCKRLVSVTDGGLTRYVMNEC